MTLPLHCSSELALTPRRESMLDRPLDQASDTSLAHAARELALDYFSEHSPASLAWSWRSAILLYGSVTLGATIGDAALLDSVAVFYANENHSRVQIRRPDAAACALPAIALYEATGDRAGLPLVARAANYLHHAPTSREGALHHFGSELWAKPLPASIWADSLMMAGVLEARLAHLHSSSAWRARALRTTTAIARALLDEPSGLFFHAVVPSLSLAFPTARTFWVRGNGWMLTAAAQIAEALVLDGCERALFSRLFSRAATRLAEYMYSGDGLPNLITPTARDAASTVPAIESSGTALCAAGILDLARLGIVSPTLVPAARKAARAAAGCITRDGRGRHVLRHTSGPTNAGPAFQYRLVREARDPDYGVGAIALAASAANDLR